MDVGYLYILGGMLIMVGIPYLAITQGAKKNLKICPFCKLHIPKGAVKCPKCHSDVKPE